jgi:hypothetical protein
MLSGRVQHNRSYVAHGYEVFINDARRSGATPTLVSALMAVLATIRTDLARENPFLAELTIDHIKTYFVLRQRFAQWVAHKCNIGRRWNGALWANKNSDAQEHIQLRAIRQYFLELDLERLRRDN